MLIAYIVNFYFLFSSITLIIRRPTPILSMMSAILNMGKLNIWISIKSLTPPKKILSIKFPKVPAMSNVVIIRLIFFVINSRIKAHIPAKLIIIIMMIGTGNDREIPSLNTGVNREISSRILIL